MPEPFVLFLMLAMFLAVAALSTFAERLHASSPVVMLVAGVLIGGPETLQGSVAPLRYAPEHRRASSVGFVNGWGSAGTVLAAPLIPVVAQLAGGMENAFALLGPLSAMAGVTCFLQWAVYDSTAEEPRGKA